MNKPHAISDQNGQNLYPISDHKGSKAIPFGVAHTYITYVGSTPPRVRYKFLVWNKTAEFCMLSGKLFHSSQSATAHFSSNKVLGTAI